MSKSLLERKEGNANQKCPRGNRHHKQAQGPLEPRRQAQPEAEAETEVSQDAREGASDPSGPITRVCETEVQVREGQEGVSVEALQDV